MPRGDKTGPLGEGPRTGRQMGYCVGNEDPGFIYPNAIRGVGYRRRFRGGFAQGRGPGFGFRHGFESNYEESIPDVSERTLIENEIRILKDQMSALEDRLSKMGERDKK